MFQFLSEAALTAYKDKSDHLKSFHKVLKKTMMILLKFFKIIKKFHSKRQMEECLFFLEFKIKT